ncbi:hypothetical protein OROHE_026777 [Orobanche hederae]
MFVSRSNSYTSLKDLLPDSPPSTAAPAPSTAINRGDSWREIPIKDPLLQHAAWAYLQPMTTAERSENEWRWNRFLDNCCGLLGCFNDVVLVVFGVGGWLPDQEQVSDRIYRHTKPASVKTLF